MPKKKVSSLRCPTCRNLVLRSEQNFPFCSDRCRLIDLGRWASGGYVISSPVNDPEEIEHAKSSDGRKSDSSGSSGERNGPYRPN